MKVETARFVRSAYSPGDFPSDGLPEIAFVGRSNVGKSSLLNRLLGRKGLARISSTPGRTRAINYFLINARFYFVDLPGYGWAKVERELRRAWAELIESYFEDGEKRLHIIQLVDAKVGATPLDVEAFTYLAGLGCNPTVAATKSDRVPRGKRSAAMGRIREAMQVGEEQRLVACSVRSGEGIKDLWRDIDTFLQST